MSGGSQTSSSTVKLDPRLQSLVDSILDYAPAIMERPFPQYDLPRIASFTPDQLQGFDMRRANVRSFQPAMNQSLNTLARFAQGPRIQGTSVRNCTINAPRPTISASGIPLPTLPPPPSTTTV